MEYSDSFVLACIYVHSETFIEDFSWDRPCAVLEINYEEGTVLSSQKLTIQQYGGWRGEESVHHI